MRIVLVALVLAGCATPGLTVSDASMPPSDGFAAPMPECRPASEDPTCAGDCTRLAPHCPDGYRPICEGGAGAVWVIGPSGCAVDGAFPDGTVAGLSCTADGRFQCSISTATRAICLPPDRGLPCSGSGW